MSAESSSKLRAAVRDVPDFPKPGIVFKDITPILADPELLDLACQLLADTAGDRKISKVVGIDARGFIFGGATAIKLGAGFVPIRKSGKLPWNTDGRAYSLEYGEAEVEIHRDAVHEGESVLVIDDLLATGGTASAAIHLLKAMKADIVGVSFLIELGFLNGRKNLGDVPVNSIIDY